MSQHDFDIANAAYATVRADINLALAAAVEHNKGSTAPTTKFVGMIWIDDTATPWLAKRWDGTDWITEGAINATANTYTPYVGTAALALATETVEGLVELSTSAENVTGTATDKWPDVAGVKEMIDTHASGGANPNLLDNPGFTVAQRGTSQAAWGGGEVYVDRWKNNRSGHAGVITVSQDATGIFAAWGHDYCMKLDVTTAEASVGTGEYWHISQVIEAQDLQGLEYGGSGAQDLSLRFLIQSPKSGTHTGFLYQPDGSRTYPFEFTVTSADTPEEITVEGISGDTSGTINNDTGGGLQLGFSLTCGSDYYGTADAWAAGSDYGTSNSQNLLDSASNNLYLGGCKLEMSSTCTDYHFTKFADDLERAKRFYQKSYEYGTAAGTSGSVAGYTYEAYYPCSDGTRNKKTYMFPVTMRATPTFSYWDLNGTQSNGTLLTNGGGSQAHYSRIYASANDRKSFGAWKDDSHQGMPTGYGHLVHWLASSEL